MSDHIVGSRGAGWLHRVGQAKDRLAELLREAPPARPAPQRNWPELARQYALALHDCAPLANSLGVSVDSLLMLDAGWSHEHGAYTFPMRDARGACIGIRTRYPGGAKRAITGSHAGLFLANEWLGGDAVWICEGPTDAAALLTLGQNVIGRPSNTGGHDFVVEFLGRCACRSIVILADRDEPESHAERATIGAAESLAQACCRLRPRKDVRILRPPGHKDARDWLKSGATPEVLAAVVASRKLFRI